MKISLNVSLFLGGLLCSLSGLAQPRADESPGVGTTLIRRTFREVDRPLANPGQGWMSQARNPKTDPRFPCSVVYIRFNWADIEPEHGTYNWQVIDDVISAWKPRGALLHLETKWANVGVGKLYRQYALRSRLCIRQDTLVLSRMQRRMWGSGCRETTR
ncbi:MAG: hypothetical protein ABSH34_31220 [Verrucomicrobiota bacterium]